MPMNIGFADVVPGRLELPTSTLSVWRSNQLSYRTVQVTRRVARTIHLIIKDSEEKYKKGKPTLTCVIQRNSAPERRCSSRTFRYGYLVTT